MKKIFSILFCALLTVACVEPLQQSLSPVDNKPADGASMTVQFSIPTSPVTKGAMTDQPNITSESNVHVFVYNATSGALLQVSKATLKGTVTHNTAWGTTESDITDHADFEVKVNMGSAHRHLQVVVDAPTYTPAGTNSNETGIGYSTNPIYLGDSEADVASKLYTQDGVTSYWQRIDLPNGLQPYTYPGGRPEKGIEGTDWTSYHQGTDVTKDYYQDKDGDIVNYGDYVNGTGQKITDGTGYVMSNDVAGRVKHIPLVRNFVHILVSKADDGTFTPKKAVLINVPAGGFIAPYSSASGFVSYYLKDEKLDHLQKPSTPVEGDLYGTEGITSTGYTAPVPGDQFITTRPDESKCVSADNSGVISLYMYERGVTNTSYPTQLLVYGRFDDSNSDTWLKIDITDADGHYIPFYRDLTYEMKIGAITGTSGHGSMKEAFDMPAVGNPSSSPETQTLTQVSDGRGTSIWVDYIDYASFDKLANTVRLRYKFVSFDGSKTSADASLTVSHITGTAAVTSTTLTGSSYDDTDTQDSQSGWYYVDVPLAAQGSTIMRSVVRVSGTATNSDGKNVTLYRDVTFSVMPKQNMTVIMSPLAEDTQGQPTEATITLDEGLGYSLFPLVIRIEAYNGSLTPTDSDLPVGHGTSTFSTLSSDIPAHSSYLYYQRSTNYYWYEKTISYGEYEAGTRVYTANFKTIYDSGNETVVAFSDPDGHFNTAVTNLRGAPTFKLAGDETTVPVKASETTASFDILSNVGTWTVTADNGAEVVRTRANSTSGSGNASIAVSFPNNMNGTAPKTYTVTVSLDSESQVLIDNYEPLTFTIEQNIPVPHMVERTVTNSSFTLSNASSITDGGGKVNLTHGSGITYNNGNNANNRYFTYYGSSGFTFSFAPVSNDATVTITGITFNWNNRDYRPSGIALSLDGLSVGSISPGGSSTNGSWTGEQKIEVDKPLIATLTRRNNDNSFRIYSISVSYTYQEQDGWE